MLRGFYALERTRTVFWIQCVVAAVNIVAAVVLVRVTDAEGHLAGAGRSPTPRRTPSARLLSYLVLRHALGGLGTARLLRVPGPAAGRRRGSTAVALRRRRCCWTRLGDDPNLGRRRPARRSW